MQRCTDYEAMYGLLKACNYPMLPAYQEAKQLLEATACYVWRDKGKVIGWMGLHGGDKDVVIDIAALPGHRKTFWRMVGGRKGAFEVLKLVFDGGADSISFETPFAKQVKMGLKFGFGLPSDDSKRLLTNWVGLEMTREQLQEKLM